MHSKITYHNSQLQLNLIRSHATGYGESLSPARVRMLLALRINVLAKGYSGISDDMWYTKTQHFFRNLLGKSGKTRCSI